MGFFFRRLARRPEIRLRWRLCGENVEKFFGVGSVWDMDIQQIELAHWLRLYTDVYELPDDQRPDDYVIENDDRFDVWLEEIMRPKQKRGSVFNRASRVYGK